MALTAPVDAHTTLPTAEESHGSATVVRRGDLDGVRLYCRLAAAVRALIVVLLALLGAWILTRLFEWHWTAGQARVPLIVAVVTAAACYLPAELRLRSYQIDLTPDAVSFEYGRKRSYVPREHIQLVDTESSILLRAFRLRRCNLHTGGGMVVVSPVPARVASAIERLIDERPAVIPTDQADASS